MNRPRFLATLLGSLTAMLALPAQLLGLRFALPVDGTVRYRAGASDTMLVCCPHDGCCGMKEVRNLEPFFCPECRKVAIADFDESLGSRKMCACGNCLGKLGLTKDRRVPRRIYDGYVGGTVSKEEYSRILRELHA